MPPIVNYQTLENILDFTRNQQSCDNNKPKNVWMMSPRSFITIETSHYKKEEFHSNLCHLTMEGMNMSSPELPPGFRFHPTDQELIIHYLKKKVSSSPNPQVSIIADVDIYKFNPWELPGDSFFSTILLDNSYLFFHFHFNSSYPCVMLQSYIYMLPWYFSLRQLIYLFISSFRSRFFYLSVQEGPCLGRMSGFSSAQERGNIQMVLVQTEQPHRVTGKQQELTSQSSPPTDHSVLGWRKLLYFTKASLLKA